MTDEEYSAPDESSWKTVWLGSPDNPDHATAGWLPVEAEVRLSQLAVFERKVTIGDASKDSDDYISSWIQGDWSGGLGVLDLAEGTDTSRYYWGCAETRFVNQTALPPLVQTSKPSAAVGTCYPLGDVYDTDVSNDRGGQNVQTHYCAWGPNPSASNCYDVFGYNEATSTWYTRTTNGDLSGDLSGRLRGAPLEKGTPFRPLNSNDTFLFIPMGASGYATLKESTPGQATVTNSTQSGSYPNPVTMCVHNDRLWAMDDSGQTWKTADNVKWTKITDMTGAATLVFDRSRTPRQLINYINRNGEPTLCLVTDQDLWMLMEESTGTSDGAMWQITAVQYPPHPDFGKGAAVWRPGEDLHIAAGMDTVRFTSANVIVPLSGPARDDGVPRNYRGAIVDLQAELSSLYALIQGDDTVSSEQTFVEDGGISLDDQPYVPSDQTYSCLMAWTGTGWHTLWAPDNATGNPTWMTVSKVPSGYRLWWGSTDGFAYTIRLRQTFHNPRAGIDVATNTGIDQFAKTGFVETGRFDAVMRGFDKIASHFTIYLDYASTTETVEVEWRTDQHSWQSLGVVNTVGMTSIPFNPDDDDFAEGEAFNWIQFKLTMTRGDNTTLSPIIDAIVLHFVKVPQNTTSFVFTVPLPKRQWMGKSAQEIDAHLTSLIESSKFIQLIHQDRRYRGKVAGISGADATGSDYSGGRTVNFIALGTQA